MKMPYTIDQDIQEQYSHYVCLNCFRKSGKKYLFGLIVMQMAVVWFIYSKSSYLLSFVSESPTPILKRIYDYSIYNSSFFHIPLTHQEDMLPFYTEIGYNVWCFKKGTELALSKSQKKCKCLEGWHGLDCGIPEAVWVSTYIENGHRQGVQIRRRKRPRRVIRVLLFVNEFDLLGINVQETATATDLFLIGENGTSGSSLLYNHLKLGFLEAFQNRMMIVKIDLKHVKLRTEKEWVFHMYKNVISESWKRLADFRPDDLFIFSRASAIVSADVIMFLKLYDGYPEPFVFSLRPLLYRFNRYIVNKEILNSNALVGNIPVGCTFEYFYSLCKYDVQRIYTYSCATDQKMKNNFEKYYWKLENWTIGTDVVPCGWSCIWCCQSEQIKRTLMMHRWLLNGFNSSTILPDLLSNRTLIIDRLVNEGKWLDGSYVNVTQLSQSDPYFLPDVVNHVHKYQYLTD